jgi:ribonuclease J
VLGEPRAQPGESEVVIRVQVGEKDGVDRGGVDARAQELPRTPLSAVDENRALIRLEEERGGRAARGGSRSGRTEESNPHRPFERSASSIQLVAGETLRIIPLGGLGEIGKNMTVVEFGGRMLVVDAGVKFPTAEMHGVDLVLPDFTYVLERASVLEAIVVTHGHEDHLGALPWLLRELDRPTPPPVYGRRLTMAMARSKLDEHGLKDVPVHATEPGELVSVGPFTLELVHLTHSIPDAAAVLIDTALGNVLFTGDYRFDQSPVDGRPADFERLTRLGAQGLLLLCGDSTNADRDGFAPSESAVGPALLEVFDRCPGRIVVTSFASNIHRVAQVAAAADELGRKVCLVGRSMVKNVKIGRSLGHIDFPDDALVQPRELDELDDDEVVIISTGSQGEPLSALRRMAYGEHRQITLRTGDTVVFSATPVPGNERAVNETIDRLYYLGCEVVTAREAPVHTSGHGQREELKLMLNLTQPRFLMPVHGDHKRLRLHARLAESVGIERERIFVGENGLPLELDAAGARFGEPVRAGMMLVDGIEIGDPADAALRDRGVLSRDGVIVLVATVAEQDGELLGDPELIMRGVSGQADGPLVEAMRDSVRRSLARAAREQLREPELLQQVVHDDLAALLHDQRRGRPMILPVIIEL